MKIMITLKSYEILSWYFVGYVVLICLILDLVCEWNRATCSDTRLQIKANYQPQSVLRCRAKTSNGSALVNMSAVLRADGTDFTIIVVGESLDRNQWYLTASDLDRGVIRGGSVVARIWAALLSSNTVDIVDIESPTDREKTLSISNTRPRR